MSFLIEFFNFLIKRKKFWLFPIILICFIFGAIIFFAEGTVIAPFIYTLF